jgi:hypothetical protein
MTEQELVRRVLSRFKAITRWCWETDFDPRWDWPAFVVRARPYDWERD